MKRAIVHMGMPKTATTSFQNAIYQNRRMLLHTHRLLYPSIDANHTNALCPMFLPDPRSHITVRFLGITTSGQGNALVRGYFRQLEAEMQRNDWDTVVFSAEGLSNLHMPALKELRSWLGKFVEHVEVIYWLRHPVSFSVSVMQQRLKGGETIEEMMQCLPLSNYRARIDNAIRAFGADNLRLYSFEDCVKHEGGPVGAFCEQIGIPSSTAMAIVESSTVENESMSMLGGYTLDALNRIQPMFQNGVLNPDRRNGDVMRLLEIKGPRFALDAEHRKRIRDASRPEMLWLKEKFGLEYYPDMLDPDFEERETVQIPDRASVESLALLVSDLLNSRR